MTFSIIGTGNIAWFFGQRLLTGRHQCAGVYDRNIERAKELAEALMAKRHGTIADIEDVADVCFLAVSDTGISEVAARLSFSNTVLVHTVPSLT